MQAISHLCMKLTGVGIAIFLFSQIPASSLLYGQTVTFAGTQTALPVPNALGVAEVAVDSAGDLFLAEEYTGFVVVLPRTATGYGPPTTLTISGVAAGVAVDSAGDLFVSDPWNLRVLELPKTSTGYGPQTTLPFTGLSNPWSIAVDSAGDVFVSDADLSRVVELPRTETGYGPQTTVAHVLFPEGITVDSVGDLFIADIDNSRVVELPRTKTGYGPQTTLPFSGLASPYDVAVDSAGDVFISDVGNSRIVELPRTETGYGMQTTLPSGLDFGFWVIGVDSVGDVFIPDTYNSRVVELQTRSVNFRSVNVCAPGQTTPASCNETLTLNYNVTASGTLRTPRVLTDGAPNLDFTRDIRSTCTGAVTEGTTCIVNVKFTPQVAGERDGTVQIVDASGKVLATTLIYGNSGLSGFASIPMALNGSAAILGTSLALTNGGLHEVASAYNPAPVNVQKFTTGFDFLLTNARADGFTFTIQNAGPAAVGADGGSLGYAGIGHSVAIKFDLFQNLKPGEDPSNNSTGIFVDGALPIGPTSIDLDGTGIDLHSGDKMNANLTYAGTTLTLTITDLVTQATWSHPFTINIPATVGGNTAYVGFTAGTGGDSAMQQILDWQFTPED